MTSRGKNMVVRVSDEELAKIHALADDRGEAISVLVREYIRTTYATRFGDKKPPTPTLKFTK